MDVTTYVWKGPPTTMIELLPFLIAACPCRATKSFAMAVHLSSLYWAITSVDFSPTSTPPPKTIIESFMVRIGAYWIILNWKSVDRARDPRTKTDRSRTRESPKSRTISDQDQLLLKKFGQTLPSTEKYQNWQARNERSVDLWLWTVRTDGTMSWYRTGLSVRSIGAFTSPPTPRYAWVVNTHSSTKG